MASCLHHVFYFPPLGNSSNFFISSTLIRIHSKTSVRPALFGRVCSLTLYICRSEIHINSLLASLIERCSAWHLTSKSFNTKSSSVLSVALFDSVPALRKSALKITYMSPNGAKVSHITVVGRSSRERSRAFKLWPGFEFVFLQQWQDPEFW